MKKYTDIFLALTVSLFLFSIPAVSAETTYPAYLLKAQSIVEKAASAAGDGLSSDDILIAKNFILNAETEYKKHLTWTGKLEPAAEPTVQYFASMAELQASIVLSKAARLQQEKDLKRIEAESAVVKAKIKVFDNKNEEIAGLKKGIIELNGELLATKKEREQLLAKVATLEGGVSSASTDLKSTQQKVAILTAESERCTVSLSASEKKVGELTVELQKNGVEIATLKQEITALAAAKGISETQSKERIEALKRQKEFVSKVSLLGGVVKPGSENMTVVFSRASLLSSPKNDKLTAEGVKVVTSLSDLLTAYPEYRIKLKVHGFGTPAKNEDASATDRMARMIRESVLTSGKFEPTRVEALGVGTAEPAYKKNIEGNRRVELIFVKQ